MIHLAVVAVLLGSETRSLSLVPSATGAARTPFDNVAVGAQLFRHQVHNYKLVSHSLAPGPCSGSEQGLKKSIASPTSLKVELLISQIVKLLIGIIVKIAGP
jgi:hypothetical protein